MRTKVCPNPKLSHMDENLSPNKGISEPVSSKKPTAHASWLKNQKCPTKLSHMEENLCHYKGISEFGCKVWKQYTVSDLFLFVCEIGLTLCLLFVDFCFSVDVLVFLYHHVASVCAFLIAGFWFLGYDKLWVFGFEFVCRLGYLHYFGFVGY